MGIQKAFTEDEHDKYVTALEVFFSQVQKKMCGKIIFELLREPCITSRGIDFYQTDIEEHLHHVGHSVPLTQSIVTQTTYLKHCHEGSHCNIHIKE